jgi:hypothetical protein
MPTSVWPPTGKYLALLPLILCLFSGVARADFTKTIQATPGVPIQAVTTWYYASCTESLGVGSYSVNVAPKYGSLSFSTVSGPVPGCPAGSPSLPAAAAFYTLSNNAPVGTSDYFQLYFLLSGNVAEVIDVTVNPEVLTISPTSLSNTVSGDPYSVQFTASGAQGTVSWSVSGGTLPAGFTLSSQGLLSSTGNPAAVPAPSLVMPGPYSFTVEAQDTVTTATHALTLTVLTADCSQKLNVNITQIAVKTNPTLSWNANPDDARLQVTTDYEVLDLPFFPDGININANGALHIKPGVGVYETPKLAYINNMTNWSGTATYGTGADLSTELSAEISQTDPLGNPLAVALPLLDTFGISPWKPSDESSRPFSDSPDVNIPILDNRPQPLTRLSYIKGFTNYVTCYFDSDQIPHTVAIVNWSANYSGTVHVPNFFGFFLPGFASFSQDSEPAVTYNIQQGPDLPAVVYQGPLANCHQTYENFPGIIPAVPFARCTP